jgi:hypothetical protein
MNTPRWWINLCWRIGGFYADRVRDPYLMLAHAQSHLLSEFASQASVKERGALTPAQYEALSIIEECRRPLLGSVSVWVA